jgi:hypothetical protein
MIVNASVALAKCRLIGGIRRRGRAEFVMAEPPGLMPTILALRRNMSMETFGLIRGGTSLFDGWLEEGFHQSPDTNVEGHDGRMGHP